MKAICLLATAALLAGGTALAGVQETGVQETSGPAVDGSPAWFLQVPAPPKPAVTPVPKRTTVTNESGIPLCVHSTACDPVQGGSADRGVLARVQWKQMGYVFSYPLALPVSDDGGVYHSGVPAVAMDSRDNLWVFQRNVAGKPQLFEFDANRKLIRTIGDDVIGRQEKAHGMAVDAKDNVWIVDADGSTIKELSPEGKLLKTIGVRNRRGDWDEAKGQRLLWQPMDLAFAPNGDIYIAEGHSNESPNDVASGDPANTIGAARVLHLDASGKFINQWFGNSVGQGKFSMAHSIGVDPRNGDVWIGDREQYRLVVYSGDGKFQKTIQMRNLMCAIRFDSHGDLWVSSGQDGQLLKLDRNGKVLGAIGNGAGRGPGQAIETTYMAWDKQANLYTGDTSVGRVTMWSVPKK